VRESTVRSTLILLAILPARAFAADPPCDYTEQHDATNDYLASDPYALEDSGLTFDTTDVTICGTIASDHFDEDWYSVDVDNYGVTLAHDADVIVSLTGDAQAIASVGVYVYDPINYTSVGSYFYGDHGVMTTHLPAGSYELSVEAYDDYAASSDVAYRVTIGADDPGARCAAVTHTADYTEQADGVDSTANDMIDTDYAGWPYRTLTSSTADSAEATGLTVASATRITGVTAARAAIGSYFDRDTYAVTTGPTTNQLSIRVASEADLDAYVFEAGSATAIGSAAFVRDGAESYATFPVIPSTTYWVWVGAYASSTKAPASYDVSLCPQTF